MAEPATENTHAEDLDDSTTQAEPEFHGLSETGAESLMEILLQRGYFHEVKHDVLPKIEKDTVLPVYAMEDATLLKTRGGYLTIDAMCDQVCRELDKQGRLQIGVAAEQVGVSEYQLERVLPRLLSSDRHLFDRELMTSSHLTDITNSVVSDLKKGQGKLALSEIARSRFGLPVDTTLPLLQERLPADVHIRSLDSGAKAVVHQKYMDEQRAQVLNRFLSQHEPVKISEVADVENWEKSWVLEILQAAEPIALPGEIHGDNYVPYAFVEGQRKSILDAFATNGVVTKELCIATGISVTQMKEIVLKESPTALALSESVVHLDVVVGPLEVAIQETIDNGGWLDLGLLIPNEILQHPVDASQIVQEVLAKLEGEKGVSVTTVDGGLFFSQALIDEFVSNRLPSLATTYAKSRATEFEKLKGQQPTDTMVPVTIIVEALVEDHAGLGSFQSDSPLLEDACTQAFCTESFESFCERAVQNEILRLQTARSANVHLSSVHEAIDVENVDKAFEDTTCFAAACYLIQARAKFIRHAANANLDPDVVEQLHQDALEGCCADFTRRVTEYALFKSDVEDGLFYFQPRESEEAPDLVHFCSPFDTARLGQYPRIVLSCTPDEDDRPRNPQKVLWSALPGSKGQALSHQWVLCGPSCIDQDWARESGEESVSDSSSPANIDDFLIHVEENCLAVCGLPFKKLDKKAEKQLLANRRTRLLQLLEAAVEPSQVLELTVRLLFQSVKNLVADGTSQLLQGPILKELLVRERKISDGVGQLLIELSEQLAKNRTDGGVVVDPVLVERVRACGQSRDISKHKVVV